MQVVHTPDQLAGLIPDGPLVLVPTMGALHEGHLSLVKRGRTEGPVVVSIFVNPTQFGPGEDYESYPRDLERDLALLEPLGVTAVFVPSVEQIYGHSDGVSIQPGRRSAGLCGARRVGHFAGVLTVVAKLFGIIRPDLAVFGRKDAQQCLVIDEMVQDLHLPVGLIDAPTVREPDGLAMSSRNAYLDSGQREQALCLFRALNTGRDLLRDGCRERATLMQRMTAELAVGTEPEYAEVRGVPDLNEDNQVTGRILLAVAARVGRTRLIDNFVLDLTDQGVTDAALLDHGRTR